MRYIRAILGKDIKIHVGGTETAGTLTWGDESHNLTITNGICLIPHEITRNIDAPITATSHVDARLTFGGTTWGIHFLPDTSHYVLHAKHRL